MIFVLPDEQSSLFDNLQVASVIREGTGTEKQEALASMAKAENHKPEDIWRKTESYKKLSITEVCVRLA